MKKQLLPMFACLAVGCGASHSDPAAPAQTSAPSAAPTSDLTPAAQGGSAAVGGDGAAPANSGAGSAAAVVMAGRVAAPQPAGSGGPAAPPAAVGGAGAAAVPSTAAYELLMSGDWTLQPGEESTRTCLKQTLTEDVYVSAIRPISPPGTHHSLLSMGEDPAADCTDSVVDGLIYAAAAGTEGLELPPGVAIKLPAGRTLKLGLHIFNATDNPLTGTSGLEVTTLAPSEVQHESQALVVGPAPFVIAPRTTQTVKSTCTLSGQQTVYAVFPHMHEYGRHLKTTVVASGNREVIHDAPFEFAEQRQYPLPALLPLNANDTVSTECTFENNTDALVEFGESTITEMCISVLFAYPPVGTGLCVGLPE
jgi:hypothetical protein